MMMDRNNVSSETAAEQLINREVFEKEDWTVEAQASAGEGREAIDYRVDTPEGLSFGIEVKRDLVTGYMTMRQMAEYFEQTAAYTRALDLPVFLGPVITTGTPSETYAGGTSCTALAAYNILGGRINVGTLVFFNYRYSQWKSPFWGMILRGDFFWTSNRKIRERRKFQNGFNPKKTTMVTSSGSKNIRKSLLEER
tara:strand:- start:22 stop:609 length:588 start_codon:yes stop_codon:yes gene_type:complete